MIEISGLTKHYGKYTRPAVSDLSLTVDDGEVLGFVGLNGAGKTTTIRISAGIIYPTEGNVRFDGNDIVKNKAKASRHIGWVPEFPNFEPNAKPLNLLIYYAGYHGIPKTEAERMGRELLSQVGLDEELNKRLRDYSQGMKKRFSLAASMISNPNNYLLDEILNGLDPEGIKYVRNLILSFKKDGKAVLLSSHMLKELESVADRIAIINKGKLIKVINRDDLKATGKFIVTVQLKNPDEGVMNILSKYGDVEILDGKYVISELKKKNADTTGEINSELISHKYIVSGITVENEDLESFFFRLIGDGQ